MLAALAALAAVAVVAYVAMVIADRRTADARRVSRILAIGR